MEKESLEEVANEYAKNRYSQEQGHPDEDYYISFLSFRAGAKWQAEKMYSEEEVFNLLICRNIELGISESTEKIEKWFKQFKKK